MTLFDPGVESRGLEPKLITDVKWAVQDVYPVLAGMQDQELGEVHRLSNCKEGTLMIEDRLRGLGQAVVFKYAIVDFEEPLYLRGAWRRGVNHLYLLEEQQEVVIDGFWQQWLPEEARTEDVPCVLLAPRPTAIRIAQDYGLTNPELQKLWLPENARP